MSALVQSTSDFRKLYQDRLPFLSYLLSSDRWAEAEKQWMELFQVKSSKRIREDALQLSGFGDFTELAENQGVQYDQTYQGPSKSFIHTLYGRGFQISKLHQLYDIDGQIKRMVPALNRSMRYSVQRTAFDFWNNGITTSKTADNLSLLNGSHTYVRGGGTWSNLSSAELSYDALQTAVVAFMRMNDPDGNPMQMSPETLMIPPELWPLAQKISAGKNMVHGANRSSGTTVEHWLTNSDPNILSGFVKNMIVSPFIDVATTWYLLGPKAQREVIWYWALKPTPSHAMDFDTDAAKTKIMYAASCGAIDARGVYGYIA